jgi:hypothetical protein
MVSGVRKWMTTSHQTTVTANKTHHVEKKIVDKPGEQKLVIELEPERHSTEAMARQSLNPVVPEAEEAEYQG